MRAIDDDEDDDNGDDDDDDEDDDGDGGYRISVSSHHPQEASHPGDCCTPVGIWQRLGNVLHV